MKKNQKRLVWDTKRKHANSHRVIQDLIAADVVDRLFESPAGPDPAELRVLEERVMPFLADDPREEEAAREEVARQRGYRSYKALAYWQIDREAELGLVRLHRAGDRRAGSKLVLAHEPIMMRVSWLIARRYAADIDDVMQEARIGITKAMDGFDEKYGCRFITYALWWIRAEALGGTARTAHMIRIPKGVQEEIVEEFLTGISGPRPHLTDKAKVFYAMKPISLEEPIYGARDHRAPSQQTTLRDAIPDESDEGRTIAEWASGAAFAADMLARLTAPLNERYMTVWRYRFVEEETLEEVGDRLGVTRERARVMALELVERARTRVALMPDADRNALFDNGYLNKPIERHGTSPRWRPRPALHTLPQEK